MIISKHTEQLLAHGFKALAGVYDPAIFKCIYMLGIPASGKSTAVRNLGLKALGYNTVNSDIYLEHAMNKAGVEPDFTKMSDAEIDMWRDPAKQRAKRVEDLWFAGRLGLIIEATSFSRNKANQLQRLMAHGYDVGILYLKTPLEVSTERNLNRKRSVPQFVIDEAFYEAEDMFDKMKEIIPDRRNTWIVLSNERGTGDPDLEARAQKDHAETMRRAMKAIDKFTKQKPTDPVAQQWIKNQLHIKNRNL